MLWAAIPALLRTRFNANEILVSLMLVYVAQLWLSLLVHGPWRDPEGFNFPQSKLFAPAALFPILLEGHAAQRRRASSRSPPWRLGWVFMSESFVGFQMRVAGLARGRGALRGLQHRAHGLDRHAGRRRAPPGIAGVGEVAGPLGQLLPTAVARLRLRRDHRRVRRPAATRRHPAREPADVAALPRRRQPRR